MFDNLIKHELTVVFKQAFLSDFKSLHFGAYIFIVIVQEEQGFRGSLLVNYWCMESTGICSNLLSNHDNPHMYLSHF